MNLSVIKWILGGVAVLALGIIVNSWRLDAKQLSLTKKELADERATLAQIKVDAKIVADASAGYQSELAVLRERNLGRPATPVRLCRATSAPVVSVPPAERGPDGGGPGAGLVPDDPGVHPGPDIGPQLRALADRADAVNAQARGLRKTADDLAPR